MTSLTQLNSKKLLPGLLLAMLLAAGAQGGPPNWEHFEQLLGRPISSREVQEFVTNYNLKQVSATTNGGVFFNRTKAPFVVIYRANNKVSEIEVTVWNSSYSRVQPYTGELPHGLKGGDSLDTVIQRLGEPVRQDGDGDHVRAFYPTLKLELYFTGEGHRLGCIAILE